MYMNKIESFQFLLDSIHHRLEQDIITLEKAEEDLRDLCNDYLADNIT